MQGWIKLYRQSLESVVFQNANLWQVWTYCLMRANHEETKIMFAGEETILKPGSFITGRFQGAEDCHMSPSTFRNQIARLKELGKLDIISDNKKSIIIIEKWTEYQNPDIEVDNKEDNKRTTNGHRQECNNEIKNIFSHWNEQKIISHKHLTDKISRKINTALKDYSETDIKTAISNYAEILNGPEYYFNYRWTLAEFLQRGFEKFLDLQTAKNNYLDKQSNTKPQPKTEEIWN